MKHLLQAGAIAIALCVLGPMYMGVQPVYAEEKACSETWDVVVKVLDDNHIKYEIASPDDLQKLIEIYAPTVTGATRGLVAVAPDGRIILGLEKDGCMLPPILVGMAKPAAAEKLSGKYSFGTFA